MNSRPQGSRAVGMAFWKQPVRLKERGQIVHQREDSNHYNNLVQTEAEHVTSRPINQQPSINSVLES